MDLVLKPADIQSKVNFDQLYKRFQAERDANDHAWWLAGTITTAVVDSWLAGALGVIVAGALALVLLVLGVAFRAFRRAR
jgi:hypothetical protein